MAQSRGLHPSHVPVNTYPELMMFLSIHSSQIPNHKGEQVYTHSTSWCTHSNIYLENMPHTTRCDSHTSITREKLNSYHPEDLQQAQYNLCISLITTTSLLQIICFHPLKIEYCTILIVPLKYDLIDFILRNRYH